MFDEREKRKDTNNRGMIIIIEASMATIFFLCSSSDWTNQKWTLMESCVATKMNALSMEWQVLTAVIEYVDSSRTTLARTHNKKSHQW